MPALYLVDDAAAQRISSFARAGGTVVISYFSGIVDTNDHVRLGGYPGAFRELLGVVVEEFGPLPAGRTVILDDGTTATGWTEDLSIVDADVVRTATDGPFPGRPAVTRRILPGGGSAWYLATQLSPVGLDAVVDRICAGTGLRPPADSAGAVELVRRVHPDGGSFLFLINHGAVRAHVATSGVDLLTGVDYTGQAGVVVPPGEVVVLRENASTG